MEPHLPSLRLKSTERYLGILVVWKCPRCECERDFCLVTRNVALSLLKLDFSQSKDMLDARCSSCTYEVRIDPEDVQKLKGVAEVTAQLKQSTISHHEYRQRLDQMNVQLIEDLKALTETWKCPTCGEDNPAGFEECWKCKGDETTEAASDDVDFPGFRKGGNPWEQ